MTPGLGTACIDMPFLSPMTRVYCSDSRTPCGPPICTCGAAHRPGIPVRVSLEGPQLKARLARGGAAHILSQELELCKLMSLTREIYRSNHESLLDCSAQNHFHIAWMASLACDDS